MTRNSPPKLGGEPARTAKREPERAKPKKKSQRGGWFPCRYWQLREPPRPRLRSGTPPNLGGECPHSKSFTAPMSARDVFFVQSQPSEIHKTVDRLRYLAMNLWITADDLNLSSYTCRNAVN